MAHFAFVGQTLGIGPANYNWLNFVIDQEVYNIQSTATGGTALVGPTRSSNQGGIEIPDAHLPSRIAGKIVRFWLEGGPAWSTSRVTKKARLDIMDEANESVRVYTWEGRIELFSALLADFTVEGRAAAVWAGTSYINALYYGGLLMEHDTGLDRAFRIRRGAERGNSGDGPTMTRRVRPRRR